MIVWLTKYLSLFASGRIPAIATSGRHSMRRTQTRHLPRPSIALTSDDIGVLREGSETNEDVLRRQLLEKDRENDKVAVATVTRTK